MYFMDATGEEQELEAELTDDELKQVCAIFDTALERD
jgi:hypothetical protein